MYWSVWDLPKSDNAAVTLFFKRETPEEVTGCTVPLHRELAIGTLKGIIRQAKISTDDFLSNI